MASKELKKAKAADDNDLHRTQGSGFDPLADTKPWAPEDEEDDGAETPAASKPPHRVRRSVCLPSRRSASAN